MTGNIHFSAANVNIQRNFPFYKFHVIMRRMSEQVILQSN